VFLKVKESVTETLPHSTLEEEGIPSSHAMDVGAYSLGKLEVPLETKNPPTVAIMLPTYNEAANIENLIREIQGLNLNLSLVIIDDSSPDGTADIVRRLQKEYENIILFIRPAKLGLGTAITAGFRLLLSLENPPNYVIAMDSDYSHNPKDIPRLVKAAKQGNHLVIGSRYITGGKTTGWPVARQIISHAANLVATMMVGMKVHDCTSGFRCYSIDYVREVIGNLHSQTYEIQIETVKQAWMNRFRIREVPIVFSNRKRGKSKLAKGEFKGFLYYIIKSKFGVSVTLDSENTEKNATISTLSIDERAQRLIDLYRRIRFF